VSTREALLPARYHNAVERWRETFIPDFDYLLEQWPQHFPKDPQFKLCAYRECQVCPHIECGQDKGKPKHVRAATMAPEQAHHLFGAIRAQASTEFGSIQQHRLTLARATSEEEQVWVLRMMAEELRHGYQMLHLLVEDDWSAVAEDSADDLVEGILAMQTGSHILGAFNIDFDSFLDNVVFCALIDRVGKYQLTMQKISAYKPMAESMPQMLREEAFHLATGVVPLRRLMVSAAKDEIYVTTTDVQQTINKWLPRGLEMFGDERGGGTNVRYGLKPKKNAEAQSEYVAEVQKLIDDLNMRFIRARLPKLKLAEAEALRRRVIEEGETVQGIAPEDLVRMPHPEFFRRRGVPAFQMVGFAGERFQRFRDYAHHLRQHLPSAYLAGRDFRDYLESLRQVVHGQISAVEASRRMPTLRRVAGSCPCSRAVRWVRDEPLEPSQPQAGEPSQPQTADAVT